MLDSSSQTPSDQNLKGLIDPRILAELRRIEIRTRRSIDSDLMGCYRTAFRGSGLVFADLREYQPGDEVKNIHWKATARTGKTYVKSYEEDRELNIILAVDVSNSTDYGQGKTRHLRALEFAALIALLAKYNNDCIGLCLFAESVEEFYPADKKGSQFQRVVLSLLKHRELARGTDVAGALRYLQEHQRRAGVVFLISDFYSQPFDLELRALSFKHDVICVLLEDEIELDLPFAGITEFADAENGTRHIVDTSSPRVRERLHAVQLQRAAELRDLCRLANASVLALRNNPLRALAELMRKRNARLR
jgi:uncharacterized protein (DUF58 family)